MKEEIARQREKVSDFSFVGYVPREKFTVSGTNSSTNRQSQFTALRKLSFEQKVTSDFVFFVLLFTPSYLLDLSFDKVFQFFHNYPSNNLSGSQRAMPRSNE